jgi:hypothetical protein
MASGEASPTTRSPPRSKWTRHLAVLVPLILIAPAIFLGCLMSGLLLPAIQGARSAARRTVCSDNIRTIALALQQYHDAHGSFPPPYIADAKGNPMHSWRVLILPYLEQGNLYKQYRFDEPWDGPNNRQLHSIVLSLFSCPSRPVNQPATDTNYVAAVGPKTTFSENGFIRMSDILDGTSNTILLVEVHNSGIHWMEPRDLHMHQMPMAINPPQG